jgi:hypothetical protein
MVVAGAGADLPPCCSVFFFSTGLRRAFRRLCERISADQQRAVERASILAIEENWRFLFATFAISVCYFCYFAGRAAAINVGGGEHDTARRTPLA